MTTAWETRDAMHASVSKIRPIRERIAKTLGGIAEVEEWEVAAMNRLHSSAQAACARVTWLRVERADGRRGDQGFPRGDPAGAARCSRVLQHEPVGESGARPGGGFGRL